MNCYEIELILHLYSLDEDPNCPWGWRGSGVYDIESDWEGTAVLTVFAESEERARELVEDGSLRDRIEKNLEYGSLDDWDIDSVELSEEDCDETEEKIDDMYVHSEPPENDDWDEPDEDWER